MGEAAPKTETLPAVPFAATVDRKAFAAALTFVAEAIERRVTIPILMGVAIEAVSADRIRLRGTDLDHEIAVVIDARGAAGATVLPAHSLLKLVRGMWGEDLALGTRPAAGDSRVSVECGPVKAAVIPYTVSDYPNFTTRELAGRVTLAEGVLHWLVAGVAHAISTEETRYYLNGVFLQFAAHRLVAVATDGHRLACRESSPVELIAGEQPSAIIPRSIMKSLAALAEGAEVTVEVYRPEESPGSYLTHMRFTVGDTSITTKLIDGTYPDWQRVVPANRGGYVRVLRRDLLRAIKVIPKNERARAVKFGIGGENLSVHYQNPDFGSVDQTIEATLHGALPMDVGANAEYLASVVGALTLDAGGYVRLHFIDAGSPIVMTADEDALVDREFALQMPMRV